MRSPPIIKKIWTPHVADLIDRLKRIDSGAQISAPYFVFKVSDKLRAHLAKDENSRSQVVSRYPDKTVYILEYDKAIAKHKIHVVQQGKLKVSADEKLLKDIREFDLLEVIYRTSGDCIIDAPDGTHFITPSEKHTKRFLRLADALHSYDALDRISYWLQAEMNGVAGIVIDTWSLASIILGSQLLLGEGGRAPFDCFRRHIKNDEVEAEKVLSKLANRMVGDGPLLCLVSVSSSGSFFNAFENLVKNSAIRNPTKVLSLYKLRDTPQKIEALATLDFPLDWFNEPDCTYCAGGETTIYQIDPKFYYPRQHQEEPIKFSKSLLQDDSKKKKSRASRFIHGYGKLPGVLRVHRDDPNDGINPRHHAFYIDVATLLKHDAFKQEVCSALKEVKSADGEAVVVVTPPHKAGGLLANIASNFLGAKYISHQNLRNLPAEDKELIRSAYHLIFLDDVLITGTRITRYLTALREEFSRDELRSLKTVTWSPIIARPSHRKKIDSIEGCLREHPWKNKLTYLYETVLPEWVGDKSCPWCQEAAVFEKEVQVLFEEPSWYQERRDNLIYGKEDGLSENPLLLLPGAERKNVGSGSPIADEGSNEMQVLFLLATALQNLRNDSQNPLGPSLFRSCVLSMFGEGNDMDVFQRYSEALFQAAFLRTVKKEEWDRHVKSKGVEHLANLISGGSPNGVLLGESILFLHRLTFARALPDGFKKALKDLEHDEAVKQLVHRFGSS